MASAIEQRRKAVRSGRLARAIIGDRPTVEKVSVSYDRGTGCHAIVIDVSDEFILTDTFIGLIERSGFEFTAYDEHDNEVIGREKPIG